MDLRAEIHAKLKSVPPAGTVYKSKEDLLIQHGRLFQPQPLPSRYRRRPPKECFANAFKLAAQAGLGYVEGVALFADTAVPLPHAWCVDDDDRVIDVTWPKPGLAYFGLVFPLARVAKSWAEDNQSVLDDWPHRFPVLNEPYQPSADA